MVSATSWKWYRVGDLGNWVPMAFGIVKTEPITFTKNYYIAPPYTYSTYIKREILSVYKIN